MKNTLIKKIYLLLAAFVVILTGISSQVFAAIPKEQKTVRDYFHEFPWIGLISNEIQYGPITITDVSLNNQQKLIYVKPNEKIKGCLNYRIDASRLESMHLYHLVVGISGVGAQDCITHTFGVWNNSGKGQFSMTAPSKPGVYQIRLSYFEGLSCQTARNTWNSTNTESSNAATIAAIIVQ